MKGGTGMALQGILALLFVIAAWSLYRLEWRGWWMAVILFVIMTASGVMTFARHDFMEMYRLAGYSDQQLALMQKFNFVTSGNLEVVCAFWLVIFLGYMLFIRKYLKRDGERAAG